MDVAEAELNRFIERRADKNPDSDEREESWKESVRRYREKERRQHLWQRLRFHELMIANHAAAFTEIIRRHKSGLAECETALGITSEEGAA